MSVWSVLMHLVKLNCWIIFQDKIPRFSKFFKCTLRQDFPKNLLNGTGNLSQSLKSPLRKCSWVKQGQLPWDRDIHSILGWAFPFDCSTVLQVFCGQCTYWAACLSECLLIYFPCWRVVSFDSRFYCIALGSLGSVWGGLDHPPRSLQWSCISRVSFP